MLASIILVTNPIIQFVTYEFLKKRLSKDGIDCILLRKSSIELDHFFNWSHFKDIGHSFHLSLYFIENKATNNKGKQR